MNTLNPTMQTLISWHDSWAVKSRIIILLVIYPLFPVLLLPGVGDVGGAPYLDLQLFYNAETVQQILLQYDEVAIGNYRLCALTVDMVYPVYYAFLLSLLLATQLKKRADLERSGLALRMLPFLMMLVDWIENITLVSIVDQWPHLNHQLANLAGFITLTKWSLLGGIVVALVVLVIKNKNVHSLNN